MNLRIYLYLLWEEIAKSCHVPVLGARLMLTYIFLKKFFNRLFHFDSFAYLFNILLKHVKHTFVIVISFRLSFFIFRYLLCATHMFTIYFLLFHIHILLSFILFLFRFVLFRSVLSSVNILASGVVDPSHLLFSCSGSFCMSLVQCRSGFPLLFYYSFSFCG